MSRIVFIWLKGWPIARLLLAQGKEGYGSQTKVIDSHRPLVTVAPGKGGVRLVALNKAARNSGLVSGELLSSARSKALNLQSREDDRAADAGALRKLALWCQRYTPLVMPWDEENGADGIFLDIAGCAHLYGGEARLLADLASRLRRFGLFPRIAVADTAGAAWGVARYGDAPNRIVPSGGEAEAILNLPLAALRLTQETLALLHRLGFWRIEDLMHKLRAPLVARFSTHLLLRLDQALGHKPEPLSSVSPPPRYHAHANFVEPILTDEHIVEAARRLLSDLVEDLTRDCVGARRLRFLLFRVDGEVVSIDIGLSAPSRNAEHLARLLALRLERLSGTLNANYGFEAAAIHVLVAESMPERQTRLVAEDEGTAPEDLACLIDRLEQRLGVGAVRRLHPHQSHIPERGTVTRRAAEAIPSDWAIGTPGKTKPPLLLPHPEEVSEVMALIPEGPPRRFCWRGVQHQVVHAEGPERIAPEWWRQAEMEIERDYYVVEDESGRRFWLYRAGLYQDGIAHPRWFVHGVFA
jgi:protein ImuB